MFLWCHRCDRSFATHRAKSQHLQNSPRHNECPECDFDGETWDELLDHIREEDCCRVCGGCNGGRGGYWEDDDAYWEHVEDCHVCTDCDRHFENANNLEQHKLSHRTAQVECLGCYREFKTYGGMIIHLESGACESSIDHLDLNSTAAECHLWTQFVSKDYRDGMLAKHDLGRMYQGKVYPFECPKCDSVFSKLSGLFQHINSSACDQTLYEGAIKRLCRFLRSRYG
ncbi:hypothetical protein DPSP01_007371 [Paraphaeosphaeria sporulosa]